MLKKNELSFLYFLFFLSGTTALIYQVLWLKQLRLLFGSTAYATATTLTVFFLGLAIGGYVFGKLAPKLKNLLRTYAFVELGIGTAALLYFLLLDTFYLIYPSLYEAAGDSFFLITLFKFLLSLILLLPAAVLIGATLPIISQFLVKKRGDLGKTVSFLYVINTLGAALGVVASGFYLPQLIGYSASYTLAISVNAIISVSALILSTKLKTTSIAPHRKTSLGKVRSAVFPIIFLSGFIVLSLEVLWTMMLSQVVVNDVYSFSLILVTFLVALASGAYVARSLIKLKYDPWTTLQKLLLLSAILVGLTPLVFYFVTGGFNPITTTGGWGKYVFSLFGMAAVLMLIPATVIGTVFPYILKIMEHESKSAGELIGSWISTNTIGAILGALVSGFIFVKFLGLFTSIGLMASIYLALSIFIGSVEKKEISMKYFLFALFASFIFLIFIPTTLSSVRLDEESGEVLLEKFTGHDGVVTVVSSHPPHYPEAFDDLFIRQNGTYTLGGLGSLATEQRQAHLPLLMHPNAKSVFFIGMGTGITAGAALYHPVDKVVTTEVVPEVVTASEKHFEKYVNGLFTDDRSKVHVEDGRNYLASSSEKFDIIIGDIFNPWVEGVGNLYTREHFENAKEHLEEGGIFAQWLPLYQLTEEQFGSIVKTLLTEFPKVTMWRGNFIPDKPIVVLVGHTDEFPLNRDLFITNVKRLGDDKDEVLIDALVSVKGIGILVINPEAKQELTELLPQLSESAPFTFYAGNLSENKELFSKFPINTDDRPQIEFMAPKALTEQESGKDTFFVGFKLEKFFEELSESMPPEKDPYLTHLSPKEIEYVNAGLTYYQSNLHEFVGRQKDDDKEINLGQELFDEYLEKMGLAELP